MDYIKKSFKKIFLPILIVYAIFAVADWVMEWLAAFLYQFVADDATAKIMSFTDYVAMLNASDNWYNNFWSVLVLLLVSPLYIGLYRFCFARLRGETPKIRSMFDFYTSPKRFFGSFVAKNLVAAAVAVAAAVISMSIGLFLSFAA